MRIAAVRQFTRKTSGETNPSGSLSNSAIHTLCPFLPDPIFMGNGGLLNTKLLIAKPRCVRAYRPWQNGSLTPAVFKKGQADE